MRSTSKEVLRWQAEVINTIQYYFNQQDTRQYKLDRARLCTITLYTKTVIDICHLKALMALQEAAEDYLVHLFEDA